MCVLIGVANKKGTSRAPTRFRSTTLEAKHNPLSGYVTLLCDAIEHNCGASYTMRPVKIQLSPLHVGSNTVPQKGGQGWETCNERIHMLSIPQLSSNASLPPTTSLACGTVKPSFTNFALTQATRSTGYCKLL